MSADLTPDLLADHPAIEGAYEALLDMVATIYPRRSEVIEAAESGIPCDARLTGDIRTAVTMAESLLDMLEPLQGALDRTCGPWIDWVEHVTVILGDLLALLYSPAFAGTGTTLADLEPTPTVPYVVKANDTFEGIAAEVLGDAERWREIAELNGLDPWVELTDAWRGLVIQVPSRGGATRTVVAGVWGSTAGIEALGHDLPNGLSLNPDGPPGDASPGCKLAGDLAVLGAPSTLGQGIQNRLLTPRGSIATNPRFGSRVSSMIGGDFGDMSDQVAGIAARQALADEPRIAAVEGLTVASEGTARTLTVYFRSIVGDAYALEAALEAA